jgi:glutamyl-tRNA reductase
LKESFPDIDIDIKLMDDLWDVIGRSDIVYTATSSVDYVIDSQKLEANGLVASSGMVNNRPLMLVDISVPRNVAEDCKDVSGNLRLWTDLFTSSQIPHFCFSAV